MADPLDLEVQPEKSIGTGNWEFSLGMPLVHVIEILKTQLHVIKHADVIFSQYTPLEGDLGVDLRENGILLKFDPYSQCLKLIDVYDVSMVTLKYNNNEFSSRDTPATNSDIMRYFGGVYKKPVTDSKLKCQLLSWPGITFAFSMLTDLGPVHAHPSTTPPRHSSGFSPSPSAGQSLHELQENVLPLKKVLVYCGENYQEAESPPIPSSCFHGNCYADTVDVLMKDSTATQLSVSLLWTGSAGSNGVHRSPRHDKAVVCFSDTAQDVLSTLGAPGKIFYKAEDKMRIHLKKEQKQLISEHSDYFFNYFTLGMDVLFDAMTHRVKKFVLHTNFPGHYNFGMYHRCNFVIRIPASGEGAERKVTPFSKWSELHLSSVEEEPYLLRRNPSTNVVNPFGSSQCYGHGNLIFEVMESGHIASVTIFSQVH